MSQRTPGQLADVDAFECRSCGYIHTKHDGEEPNQCVDCGAKSFKPVHEEATNRTDDSRGPIASLLSNASFKEIILYLVFILLVFGGMVVSLALILF